MKPVVTSAEMAEADRVVLAATALEALVARAGGAVAAEALAMLGGAYGRRVVVVAGKGNNGADGRVAAEILSSRGAQVRVFEAATCPESLAPCDLVVDAAYGTGFRGEYTAPRPPDGALVLAVDIASGVDANLGTASPGAVRADATVTFQALKPGLLLGEGPERCGRVTVADIGIQVGDVAIFQVCDDDLASVPQRPRESHKWKTAVFVCAGSPGLYGAPLLAARGAMRAGAGMVRLGVPGGVVARQVPLELVEIPLAEHGFAAAVLADAERCKALVLGPGLGRTDGVPSEVAAILARAAIPVVLDADGIVALGDLDAAARLLRARPAPTVLTPHDGEYARLVGHPPGEDRIGAARTLARATGAVVLLKGSTTVVADPGGVALLSTSGSAQLATAGTGDVLSGVIGAFVARGMAPQEAAAIAAHVHGRAAGLGRPDGLVAGDLPDLVADVLSAAWR